MAMVMAKVKQGSAVTDNPNCNSIGLGRTGWHSCHSVGAHHQSTRMAQRQCQDFAVPTRKSRSRSVTILKPSEGVQLKQLLFYL